MEKSILIIGAATLDRLLYVQKYPEVDSKSACTTQEGGGGNAANTASAIGRLLSPSSRSRPSNSTPHALSSTHRVQLLTKVARDPIGNALVEELMRDGVDLSSPLFLRSPSIDTSTSTSATASTRTEGIHATSPVVTVIVTSTPPYTRTCLFDPGTVGTLVPQDLHPCKNESGDTHSIDGKISADDVLKHCTHLHSDTRHTEVALFLAKQAHERGIPISVDVERDRFTPEFDALLSLADIVFTNEHLMSSIVSRQLGFDLFGKIDRKKITTDHGVGHDDGNGDDCGHTHCDSDGDDFYCNVARLCHFLSRERTADKALVVTRGELGAVHCKLISSYHDDESNEVYQHFLTHNYSDKFDIVYNTSGEGVIRVTQQIMNSANMVVEKNEYLFHAIGTLKGLKIVDTTGAGDAFIGGFIYGKHLVEQRAPLHEGHPHLLNEVSFCILFQLRYASWVAGRKIGGIGARQLLPTAEESDDILGVDIIEMDHSLQSLVSTFSS